jgi:hypothetical protein
LDPEGALRLHATKLMSQLEQAAAGKKVASNV